MTATHSAELLSKFHYLLESIEGKTVLVTGGTTGIGRATALLLAEHGAKVALFGRHGKEMQDTLEDFEELGLENRVYAFTADVSKKEDIQRIFQEVDDYFAGKLDILINNAALGFGGIQEGEFDDWQYVLETNILGYLACSREAVKRMKNSDGGHIVNIGSISADKRSGDSTVYVATKGAIQAFSTALRKEVNPLGIKVTLIQPGKVGSDMLPESPEEQRQRQEELTMLKAEDIASCVFYCLIQPKRCDLTVIQIEPHALLED